MSFLPYILSTQKMFWGKYVKHSWNSISLTEKVARLIFFNQTIAIITIIEILLLK